jgi:hypothetical protein
MCDDFVDLKCQKSMWERTGPSHSTIWRWWNLQEVGARGMSLAHWQVHDLKGGSRTLLSSFSLLPSHEVGGFVQPHTPAMMCCLPTLPKDTRPIDHEWEYLMLWAKIKLFYWMWCSMPGIPTTQQAEMRGSLFKANQEKLSETPSQRKPGIVAHTCHPNFLGGRSRKITV